MTLLTSLAPCVHQVSGWTSSFPRRDVLTLAEHFRAAGYRTAAFTENGLITANTGFARGFDRFGEDTRGANHGVGADTFATAAAWFRAQGRTPWFAFVHTYEVHHPYTPPPGYRDLMTTAPRSLNPDSDPDNYDGEVRYVDDLVAGLLGTLEEAGVADHTLVVLVSDHGDLLGEHGEFGHGTSTPGARPP